MRRSIEFPVDRRWVKNPTNTPLATPAARMGAAAQTKLCITTIGLILSEHFTAPTPFYPATVPGDLRPNRWTITLTRISMGTLDPITGGASMKAVQDAIALWCGVKNERDPVWHWIEPIRQEKRGKGFFGVRIVIEDLAPGEPRTVTLKTIEPFIWKAKQRIREAKMYKDGIKRTGSVLTYQPEAGARAASSAARQAAEERFAKLQGIKAGTIEAVEARNGKPTALDLRDAAERLLATKKAPTFATRPVGSVGVHRDPGEERPARDLAACTTCRAEIGQPCREVPCSPPIALVYGVHPERARAAGLQGVQIKPRDRAHTNGHRRIVPPAQERPHAYARLPWERVPCEPCRGKGKGRLVGPLLEAREDRCAFCGCTDEEPCWREDGSIGCSWAAAEDVICSRCKWTGVCSVCDGRGFRGPVRREEERDGEHSSATVVYDVPAEHRARFGDRVTLTRRRTTLPKLGDVWLYE